jgi:hypothetical protein
MRASIHCAIVAQLAQSGTKMAENGTRPAKLLRRKTDGGTFMRIAPPAAFLSQMIAADRAPRLAAADRRAPINAATSAYATGSRFATRRMPVGYRTTVVA